MQLSKNTESIETISKCKHKDCYYRGYITGGMTCDYCFITGHSRGCKISECNKYIANAGVLRKRNRRVEGR